MSEQDDARHKHLAQVYTRVSSILLPHFYGEIVLSCQDGRCNLIYVKYSVKLPGSPE